MRALPVLALVVVLLPALSAGASSGAPPATPAAVGPGLELSAAIAAADGDRGPLGRAAARLAAGDGEAAIGACQPALEGPDGPACRLVSAQAALAADRPLEAAGLLAPVRGKLGELEPWGALLHGEALAAGGDPAAALAALDLAAAADPGGPLGRRAAPARVLALARSGQAGEAKAAAAGLRGKVPPRVRLILADALAAAGDESAPEAYRELWRDSPGTPEADRARARLAELGEKGVAVPPATAADRLLRADRLLDRGLHEAAARELSALSELRTDADQKARAELLAARGAVARGDRALAEKLVGPLLARATGASVPEALELGARLAMRRGDTDVAVARLDRIARGFPGHRLALEAEYLAAFFLYDAGRFAEAEARFQAFVGAHPRAARADEAAWYAAWSTYLGGRHADAAKAFAALLAAYPRSPLGLQVRYWRGRALERAGDRAGARAVFRDLSRQPEGWYPLLAELRLGRRPKAPGPGPTAPTAGVRAPKAPAPADVPLRTELARARLARAVALYRAGLPEAAGEELDAAAWGEKRAAVLEDLAQVALAAGDAFRAHRLGGRLPRARGADLAYPRAFAADVERAARGLAVDPHFVWAIMRRESAFRPAVRSPAAAVGLMQLLPKTARRICELEGLDLGHAERLGEPAVNVALGTWYLAKLLERFGGNPALAAAGYNAGPNAVVRWLGERKGLELDEFVESIPYRETRHYVKHVIGDLAVYRGLGGEAPPALAGKLPAAGPGVSF